MLNKILVAVDGSQPSLRALDLAGEIAQRFETALRARFPIKLPREAMRAECGRW